MILHLDKQENNQMCSAYVVSPHNDVKGMFVPEHSKVLSGQFQVLTYAVTGSIIGTNHITYFNENKSS